MLFAPVLLLSLSLSPDAAAEDAPAADAPAADAPAADAPAEAAGPTTYTIDPAKGLVYVKVLKDEDTLMSGLSHNHVMKAAGFSGSFTWNPDDPASCKVSMTVPVQELVVDAQWLRDKVGFTGKIDDKDRKTIQKNMLDKGQLNASAYPNITFEAGKCTGSNGSFKVHGTLTVRGKGKPVAVLMDIDATDDGFRARGTLEALHTDFGFEPYSAMMGGLKNRNDMYFAIDIQGAAN